MSNINNYKAEYLDPTAPSMTTDFPYDEVDRNLGAPIMDEEDAARADLVKALGAVFDWIAARGMEPNRIGRRAIIALWVINPARFGKPEPSLHKIAEKLGCSCPHMSELAAEFSKQFKISNRFQAHDWRKQ